MTERVYFDVSICGGPSERLVIIKLMSALNFILNFCIMYFQMQIGDWLVWRRLSAHSY